MKMETRMERMERNESKRKSWDEWWDEQIETGEWMRDDKGEILKAI